MTPHTRQATPRGRSWATDRPSRLWLVAKAVAVIALLMACGIEDIRF